MESGVQLFSRLNSGLNLLDNIHPELFPDGGGPKENQIFEILYERNEDFTDFIIDFIARAILPTNLNSTFKECQVILIQTDFQINLLKIIKFIEKKLQQININKFDEEHRKQEILEESLKRLIFLNCFNADQLEITSHNLENIIGNCTKLGLIILDNCLANYWTKRFDCPGLTFDKHCSNIIGMFHQKIKYMNLVFMYGKPPNDGNNKAGTFATYQICVQRKNTDGFIQIIMKNLIENNQYNVAIKIL